MLGRRNRKRSVITKWRNAHRSDVPGRYGAKVSDRELWRSAIVTKRIIQIDNMRNRSLNENENKNKCGGAAWGYQKRLT
jgi:hypothetical protein